MQYEDILYEQRDHVVTITLNRPRVMNAFRGRTCEELIHAFNRAGGANYSEAAASLARERTFAFLRIALDAQIRVPIHA